MSKNYVVFTAQNYTRVDKKALKVVQNFAKLNKAKLVALPLVYNTKEKDLFGTEVIEESPQFDPVIEKYLLSDKKSLNDNLDIIPFVHTRPTSKDQLSGLQTYSKSTSAVFAGVRHRLMTVATPGHLLPKIICTAPTVTVPKYSQSSSGIAAKAMHQLGAVFIKVADKKIFHIRQLTVNEKYEIHYLGKKYKGAGKATKAPVEGVVFGDLHHLWADPDVVAASFTNKNSIVKSLKPKSLVFHDFIDFYSANHHHVGDRLIEFLKAQSGLNDVHSELMKALEFLHKVTPKTSTSYIVGSNHNDALDRWLNSGRGDYDTLNAPLYHLLNYARYSNAKLDGPSVVTSNPIEDFGKQFCPEYLTRSKFLGRGESLNIGGFECAYHGDKGIGGSRGNIKQFSNIGCPTITGHTHNPAWYNGALQVGTSSLLSMGYNDGDPSNWLHTHAIINADGTATLVNIIQGQW